MNDHNITDSYTATWLPGVKSKRLTLDGGIELRYVEIGHGEPLLLMHTLNTQLDYFQRLAPLLKDRYRVILIDLPGHGYSTIDARAAYDEPFFRNVVLQAVKALGLKRFAIGGESIGASLACTVAAALPKQVTHVYAFDLYDYGTKFGGGIRQNKYGFIIALFRIFRQWTFKPAFLFRLVFSGSFAHKENMPEDLVQELVHTGNRKYYRRAEYMLFKHWRSWKEARKLYSKIKAPVTVVYGEKDWSFAAERLQNKELLSLVQFTILPDVGHFSALEAPETLAQIFLQSKS